MRLPVLIPNWTGICEITHTYSKEAFQTLLISADGDRVRACIKAATKEESSAWRQALHVSSLGLLM